MASAIATSKPNERCHTRIDHQKNPANHQKLIKSLFFLCVFGLQFDPTVGPIPITTLVVLTMINYYSWRAQKKRLSFAGFIFFFFFPFSPFVVRLWPRLLLSRYMLPRCTAALSCWWWCAAFVLAGSRARNPLKLMSLRVFSVRHVLMSWLMQFCLGIRSFFNFFSLGSRCFTFDVNGMGWLWCGHAAHLKTEND